ncbi:protein YIPF7-like [Sycon ciliatum]|uniref:protein YIPF7-like n=1 Tax=Sycon ciliatum TaxID=27933 RepID=UPI0031F6A00A|eukprot:scpid59318/ scgid33692/ Protein YIPF7; YIP1 family member 7
MTSQYDQPFFQSNYGDFSQPGGGAPGGAAAPPDYSNFAAPSGQQPNQFYNQGSYSAPPPTQPDQYTGSIMQPDQPASVGSTGFDDEPPLLEELGINFDHIYQKSISVLNPTKPADSHIMDDTDLAGPLVVCIVLGMTLLLSGKVQFGYIYGMGVLGSGCMYALLNLMSTCGVTVSTVISVLGYCLLPMLILAAISVLISLQGIVGTVLAVLVILWCSVSASKLFVAALVMESQQLLVAYPCCLLYGVFALLTVF